MKGRRIYRIVWSGVVAPLGTTGFVAAVLLSAPALAAVLALAIVGTSPRVVRSSLRWWEAPPPTSAATRLDGFSQAFASAFPEFAILPGTPPAAPSTHLAAMTDEQLCRQWRTSCTLVQEASARQLGRVLQTRQGYLDELERRNEAGFGAWLASGARAESDPLPYLRGERAVGSAIDWNELTSGHDG